MSSPEALVEPLKARRIYLVLRDRIASGTLRAGERLAGEPRLAAEHAVSRATLRRALDQLTNEGLLTRRPGAGTFVREGRAAAPIVADLANVLTHLVEMGRQTGVRLLAFGYDLAPPDIAEALRLEAGERVQRSVRVRLIDGEPFSHLTTFVPERIGLRYSEVDLAARPLLELLERSGVTVSSASQAIGASLAGPDVAEALDLAIGSPLIGLTRVVYGPGGEGVEYLQAHYRPDRYSFAMELKRAGKAHERHWSPVLGKAS